MFYRSKNSIGYMKSITSEQDFIQFINRLSLEQSMIISLEINGEEFQIDKLNNIFKKAVSLREEAI
ncbi:hypothetical protein AB3Z07_21340 [Metabacillus halosaccharovorans]|uniref:hypothetical protein n=1 Tax=Metabacillus halosaccharovorans TaxID=930124 RepID=UPI0034CF7CC0